MRALVVPAAVLPPPLRVTARRLSSRLPGLTVVGVTDFSAVLNDMEATKARPCPSCLLRSSPWAHIRDVSLSPRPFHSALDRAHHNPTAVPPTLMHAPPRCSQP